MAYAVVIFLLISLCHIPSIHASVFDCIDFIAASDCATILANGDCETVKGRNKCKKTCDFCGGWTAWSIWGDCNAPKCGIEGERSRGRRCRQKSSSTDCQGSSVDVQKCVSDSCYESKCGFYQFECVSMNTSQPGCFAKSRICDGFSECLGDFDENDCKIAGGPSDDFFIASLPISRHCLKVMPDDTVDFTWDCPSRSYKEAYWQLWKWYKRRNLINIETGKCLAISAGSVVVKECNNTELSQVWNCNNKELGTMDTAATLRHFEVSVSALIVTALPAEWHSAEDGKSLCEYMNAWTEWSNWSECMPRCRELGQGKRTRSRKCADDRCPGPSLEIDLCFHEVCSPTCPPGFSSLHFPWSCYKFVNQTATYHKANEICSEFSSDGVRYGAVLAADKNNETNALFRQLMKENGVSEAYIGVDVKTAGMNVVDFTFHSDKQPVGMLSQKKKWHETVYGEFLKSGDGGPAYFLIQHEDGKCLNIDSAGEAKEVPCTQSDISWVFINKLLYHVLSEKCLAWKFEPCSPAAAGCTWRNEYKFVGKPCTPSDDHLLWDLHGKSIKPVRLADISLSVIVTNIMFDDMKRHVWLAWTEDHVLQSLSELRLESRTWHVFMHEDFCLSVSDSMKVILEVCENRISSRWSWLSDDHLVHRKSDKCLSVSDGMPVDGSVLQLEACDDSNQLQKWTLDSTDGFFHVSPVLSSVLTITPDISNTEAVRLGMITSRKTPFWTIKKYLGSDRKFRIFSPTTGLGICWKPTAIGCAGSKVLPATCDDIGTSSWWVWTRSGRKLLSVPRTGKPATSCCLQAPGLRGRFVIVNPCNDNSRYQDFTTIDLEQNRDGMMMTHFPNIILTSESGVIWTLDSALQTWNAMQVPDTFKMDVEVMRSCRTSDGGLDHAIHRHTKGGVECQAWDAQSPHEHGYPSVHNNYCRSPSGYDSDIDNPWCLTTNPTERWDECNIPHCYRPFVVTLGQDGTWKISDGDVEKHFFCETQIECVTGIGESYNGTVKHAGSGKPCLNWRAVHAKIYGSSDPNVPDHSFCRNPDGDLKGPWCWTGNVVKEYCDYIQKCQVRCSTPPVPIGGSIGHLEYLHGGPNYANGSKVSYSCDVNRKRNRELAPEEDFDMICADGEWVGTMIACDFKYCMTPEHGINNSFAQAGKKILYGDSYAYRCYEGYMFSTGRASLTLTCSEDETWSTAELPAENYLLDRNNISSEEISRIACHSPCPDGFDAVSDWCVSIQRSDSGVPVHDNELTCAEGYQAPIEAGMNPHLGPHARKTLRGKILLTGSKVASERRALGPDPFVSAMTDSNIPDDTFFHATFYIKTVSKYRISGDADEDYLCLQPRVSPTNPLDVFTEMARCPDDETRPNNFFFRWATPRHLLHMASQKCLTLLTSIAGETAGFKPCDWTDTDQTWTCNSGSLYNYDRSRYLHMHDPDATRTSYWLSETILYSLGVKVNALRSYHYPEMKLCDSELRPRDSIYSVSCGVGNEDLCDSDTLADANACKVNDGASLSRADFTSWAGKPCECGRIRADRTSVSGCGHVSCSAKSQQIWCKRKTHPVPWITLLSNSMYCLALDIASGKVVEVPCDMPVFGKACVTRSRFTCYGPTLQLDHGYVKDTKPDALTLLYEPVYPIGGSVSYVCDDGYLFADGSMSKELTCQNNRLWTKPSGHFECILATCTVPAQPVNADKIAVPTSATQLDLGTVINVRCDNGYVIAPGVVSTSSVCGTDGKWHPPVSSCKPSKCGEPPYIADTQIVGTSFTLHSVIMYKCVYGMHFQDKSPLIGSNHTCQEDGDWVPSPYNLTCIQTTCPEVDHVLRSFGDGVGKTVSVGCGDSTNILTGNGIYTYDHVEAICTASGKWEPDVFGLKCAQPQCDESVDIQKAEFLGYKSTSVQGTPDATATAEYSCRPGYVNQQHFMIFNNGTRLLCLRIYKLGKTYRARLVSNCVDSIDMSLFWRWWPEQTDVLQHVETGFCLKHSMPVSSVGTEGSQVYLDTCQKQRHGQMWNCQTIGSIPHYVTAYSHDGKSVLFLKQGTLRKDLRLGDNSDAPGLLWMAEGSVDLCQFQSRKRNFHLVCSSEGTWIPEETNSICVPVKCYVPKDSKGVSYSGHAGRTEMGFEAKINGICENGYSTPSGAVSTIFSCSENGTWTPDLELNRCQPVSCGPPPEIEKASVLSGTNGDLYMSEREIKCDKGLWFKDLNTNVRKISCGRDASWSITDGPLIECTPVYCDTETIKSESTFILPEEITANHYGTKIEVSCPDGFSFEDFGSKAVLYCDNDGSWAPSDLTCTKSYCGLPQNATSYADLVSDVQEESPMSHKATYKCRDDQEVGGSDTFTVTCGKGGTWTPDPATVACRHATCPDPHEIAKTFKLNVQITVSGVQYGDVAIFQCATGHVFHDMEQSKRSTCKGRYGWNTTVELLRCYRRTCPVATSVANLVIEPITGHEYGDLANITCRTGYSLSRRSLAYLAVFCSSLGQWMPDISGISCVMKRCTVPRMESNVAFKLNTPGATTVGSEATISCADDFVLNTGATEQTLICNNFAEWTPAIDGFQCVQHLCDFGAEFQPFCPDLFYNSPSSGVKAEPFCVPSAPDVQNSPCAPVTCHSALEIADATIVAYKEGTHHILGVNAQVTYKCRTSYHFKDALEETVVTRCTESGMWVPNPFEVQCLPNVCTTPENAVNDFLEYTVGGEIHITCKPGYVIPDGSEEITLTCQLDGRWFPYHEGGTCQEVDCGTPYPVAYSRVKVIGTTLGSKAHYQCYEGYRSNLTSFSWFATCAADGVWRGTHFHCLPRSKFLCGAPKSMPHTTKYLPSSYLEGEQTTYECEEGFLTADLKQSVTVTCSGSGYWVPDIDKHATCQLVTCPYPSDFNFALNHITSPEPKQPHFSVGETIITRCELGYFAGTVASSVSSTCQMDSSWYPDPTKIFCIGSPCEALPKIENAEVGRHKMAGSGFAAIYRCKEGYQFLGSASPIFITRCSITSWDPSPMGRECTPVLCEVLPNITNALPVAESLTYNSIITVTCQAGYQLPDGFKELKLFCDSDGLWKPKTIAPECQVVDCGPLIMVSGATAAVVPALSPPQAEYRCVVVDGVSRFAVSCNSAGVWQPFPPNVVTCPGFFCTAPPFIRNAVALYGENRFYKRWHYRCLPGFQVRPKVFTFSIRCNFPAEWDVSYACSQASCGDPPPVSSAYVAAHNLTEIGGVVKQTVVYKCKAGTWISNGTYKALTFTSTCVGGIWQPDPETSFRCVPVTCAVPVQREDQFDNGTDVSGRKTVHFRSTVSYRCPKGYFFRKHARNAVTISCTENGEWSGNYLDLTCEPVVCSSDVEDPNADWDAKMNTEIGAQLNVSCHPTFWYYPQVFSIIKTCGVNGRWTPEVHCTSVNCPLPVHNRVEFELLEGYTDISGHSVGSVLRTGCKPGYNPQTTISSIRCLSSGNWDPSPSSVLCKPKSCTSFAANPDNGKIAGSNLFNTTSRLQCDVGYMISPGVTVISSLCLADQTWTVDLQLYSCRPLVCVPDYTNVDPDLQVVTPASNYSYGEVLKVVCEYGFKFDDGRTAGSTLCTADATFNPPIKDFACLSIQCPIPEDLGSVRLDFESHEVGSSLTVRCMPFHWIAIFSQQKWILTQAREMGGECSKYGTWSFDEENFKCLRIQELPSQSPKSQPYQITHVPISTSNWIAPEEDFVMISFEKEIAQSDAEDILIGDLASGRAGLFQNDTSSDASNGTGGYNVTVECEWPAFNQVGEFVNCTLPDKQTVSRKASDVENSVEMSDRQSVSEESDATIKTASRRMSYPSDLVSSNLTFLWDGDSRSVWAPDMDDKDPKFQIHFGKPYVVEEILLMGDFDGSAYITFSTSDGSLPLKEYGPISLEREIAQLPSQEIGIARHETLADYGRLLILSGFDSYPTTILEISFTKPPYLREFGLNTDAAKAIVVAAGNIPTDYLAVPISLILVLLIAAVLGDMFSTETYQLTWRSSGFTLQYRSKTLPSSDPGLFFEIVPIMKNSNFCFARNKRDREPTFVCDPQIKTLKLKLSLASCKRCPRRKHSLKLWDIQKVKVAYNGTVWTAQKDYVLRPDSTVCILLQQPDLSKGYRTNGLLRFLTQHSLSFVCPVTDLNNELNSYVSSLIHVCTSLLVAFAVAVISHLNFKHDPDANVLLESDWYQIVMSNLLPSFIVGSCVATICLLLLRVQFVGYPYNKHAEKFTAFSKEAPTNRIKSKLALSKSGTKKNRSDCPHLNSSNDEYAAAQSLSVYSTDRVSFLSDSIYPSSRAPEKFSVTKQIIEKDFRTRKFFLPILISGISLAVSWILLQYVEGSEGVPAVHAGIGACLLFLVVGTLFENGVVFFLFGAVESRKNRFWTMSHLMPAKNIDTTKSTSPTLPQNLRRRPSKPCVTIDTSVQEPGLPTAILIPKESETDLLSAIERRIHAPNTATLHQSTQTGISKLRYAVDYGKCGLDFDFLLACDVDLYVRCQKENVTFEEIERELGRGVVYDLGDKPKPEPEPEPVVEIPLIPREMPEWGLLSVNKLVTPEMVRESMVKPIEFTPTLQPVPETDQVASKPVLNTTTPAPVKIKHVPVEIKHVPVEIKHVPIPNLYIPVRTKPQSLQDRLDAANKAALVAKLEKRFNNIEKILSDDVVSSTQNRASSHSGFDAKPKISTVDLPKGLVAEILKYLKGSDVNKVVKNTKQQDHSDVTKFGRKPSPSRVISYRVKTVHPPISNADIQPSHEAHSPPVKTEKHVKSDRKSMDHTNLTNKYTKPSKKNSHRLSKSHRSDKMTKDIPSTHVKREKDVTESSTFVVPESRKSFVSNVTIGSHVLDSGEDRSTSSHRDIGDAVPEFEASVSQNSFLSSVAVTCRSLDTDEELGALSHTEISDDVAGASEFEPSVSQNSFLSSVTVASHSLDTGEKLGASSHMEISDGVTDASEFEASVSQNSFGSHLTVASRVSDTVDEPETSSHGGRVSSQPSRETAIGSSTVDSSSSSLEGLQSLKRTFMELRATIVNEYGDKIPH